MATSTSSADIKSVKVPTFDGKRDSFQLWWLLFQAFSKAYKFRSAIDDTKESDLPDTESPQQGDTTAQVEARERNSTAAYYLTLAFESGESMKCTLQNRFGVCCECSSNRTKVVVATARRQQAGVITFDDLEDCLEDYYRQV
jgi:hypothetical protein